MQSIGEMSKKDLASLYQKTADFMAEMETLIPTTSVTGILHHGNTLLAAIENRLNILDPLPRRAVRKSTTVAEVK